MGVDPVSGSGGAAAGDGCFISSTFFNRFAGLRSGNGEFFTGVLAFLAWAATHIVITSRLRTLPLNTFKSALLLLHLFGPLLIVSRLAGVLERLSASRAVVCTAGCGMLVSPAQALRSWPRCSRWCIISDRGPLRSRSLLTITIAILFAMLRRFCGEPGRCELNIGGWAGEADCWPGRRPPDYAAGLCLLTKQTIGLPEPIVLVPSLVMPAVLFLRRSDAAATHGHVDSQDSACRRFGLPVLAAFALWLRHLRCAERGTFLEMLLRDAGRAAKAGHAYGDFADPRMAMVARGNLALGSAWHVLGGAWLWGPLSLSTGLKRERRARRSLCHGRSLLRGWRGCSLATVCGCPCARRGATSYCRRLHDCFQDPSYLRL